MSNEFEAMVMGCDVQVKIGAVWVTPTEDQLTAQVRMEIEGEIEDGGKESGEIVASNGFRYRW